MAKAIIECCPVKINIGPVYSYEPSRRLELPKGNFMPVERELIFDIDCSVYEYARYCCHNGPRACSRCWPLMAVAIKLIDSALRDVFGYKHILWVFSGRRGVHCWVCDGKARRLNNEQRAEIADYFRVYKGNEDSQKNCFFEGKEVGHLLARESSRKILKDCFEQLIHTQSCDCLDKTSLGNTITYFRSFLSPLLKSCEEEIRASCMDHKRRKL